MPLRAFLPWDPWFFERSPLFEPLVPLAQRFAGEPAFPAITRWNELLGEGLPVRFQEQVPAPRGRRRLETPRPHYSTVIHREKLVPSRAGSWHDFFNALVWAAFPRSKRALYARQNAAVGSWVPENARHLPNRRTRELDALALLDEGGAIVLADAVLVFGHAIHESVMLQDPPETCRASTVVLPADRLPGNHSTLLELADRGLEALLQNGDHFQEPKREPGLLLKLRP